MYNYSEKIYQLFKDINDLIDQTSLYYKSETGDQFRRKFENFKINFEIVNNKLNQYIDELASVKMKYHDLSFDIYRKMKNNMNDLNYEFK